MGWVLAINKYFSAFNAEALTNLLNEKHAIRGIALALFAVFGWGASTVLEETSADGTKVNRSHGRKIFVWIARRYFYLPTVRLSILTTDVTIKFFVMALLAGVLGIWLYYKGLEKVPARVATLAEMFSIICSHY